MTFLADKIGFVIFLTKRYKVLNNVKSLLIKGEIVEVFAIFDMAFFTKLELKNLLNTSLQNVECTLQNICLVLSGKQRTLKKTNGRSTKSGIRIQTILCKPKLASKIQTH